MILKAIKFLIILQCSQARDRSSAMLRLALGDSANLFGCIIMAGRFGCAMVNDTMAAEEVVPGVTPAVMRNVRAARLEADRHAREAQAHAIAAPQRRPQYYPQPQVAAAVPPRATCVT
jgi:hypothetical protein